MGIRLDWEIEADQAQVRQSGEDPSFARRRRRARLWIIIGILAVVAAFGGIVMLINWRLQEVNQQVETLLRNTVDAEVAALRLGDLQAFMAAQRSASPDWLTAQAATFQDYQQLKLNADLQLTGQILDIVIENPRARVAVQEIIDGVPYTRIWFYWRYDDGWRHVPPDYLFWGEVAVIEAQSLTVRYQLVDAPIAQSIVDAVDPWLQATCQALACAAIPPITVEILPNPDVTIGWSQADPWRLVMPSPFVGRARSDMPFDTDQRVQVGALLADRLILSVSDNFQPAYPTDAYYFRQAISSWLVGRLASIQTNAFVIDSLARAYGDQAVGRALRNLRQSPDVGALVSAAAVASPNQLTIDWRDFLSWRLAVESELIARRDEDSFLSLYDLSDPNAGLLAAQRFGVGGDGRSRVVIAAELGLDASGVPVLRAVVQVGGPESDQREGAAFRLADGTWKRTN